MYRFNQARSAKVKQKNVKVNFFSKRKKMFLLQIKSVQVRYAQLLVLLFFPVLLKIETREMCKSRSTRLTRE